MTTKKVEEDVQTEIDRVQNCELHTQSAVEPLIISGLSKRFIKGKTSFMAVNNLSFGINHKECFG